MAEKKPGRGSDQFPLRFPDGMREEIKRLAEDGGQSMNTKIVELLTFATENSGLDIDELLEMLSVQRHEISRLRKVLNKERSIAYDALWHVLKYIEDIPPELTIWIDNMLRILDPESDTGKITITKDEESDKKAQADNVEERIRGIKRDYSKWMDESVARIFKTRGLKSKLLRKTDE